MYELKDDDGYLLMENHEFNPYKVSVSKLKNMLKPKDHPDISVQMVIIEAMNCDKLA